MISALVVFLVYLVAIVIVAGLLLWAIRYFLPEFYGPARLVVGGVAIIVLLLLLLQILRGGTPALSP